VRRVLGPPQTTPGSAVGRGRTPEILPALSEGSGFTDLVHERLPTRTDRRYTPRPTSAAFRPRSYPEPTSKGSPWEGFHHGQQETRTVYAVVRDRNQQIRVQKGDIILCDLNDKLTAGDKITFDEVLILGHEGSVQIGKPSVAGAHVTAEVIGHEKGVKVIAFRFKRRKNVRKKRGFRAQYTRIRITDIVG